MHIGIKTVAAAIAATALWAGSASAAAIPWGNSSGSTANFSYSGGETDNGLFGDPTVTDGGFTFLPSGFSATAVDGGADVTSDRAKVTVTANPGEDIDKIVLRELGDYNILGPGSVSVGGGLFVVWDGGPVGGVAAETLFDPSMPIVVSDGSGASGNFEGMAMIVLPEGVTEVDIVFNNSLLASAGEGGAAFIQKKTAGLGIGIDIIVPEPASVALLGFAPLMLRRRRA